MNRVEIINYLIREYGYKNYLEIGVCNPKICFDHIVCDNKSGVDPGVEFAQNPVKYQMTSDEFFDKLKSNQLDIHPDTKWDLIFIDGLHISDQVKKDILNSVEHLSWNGLIILHDCNPPSIWYAREDYIQDGRTQPWNGTVWKAIYWLRTHRDDLDVCVLDTDWGVGVVRKSKSELIPFDNPFYEYNKFSQNRQRDLNLIPVQDFESWLKNKI